MNQREKQRLRKQAARKRKCDADNVAQSVQQKHQRLEDKQHSVSQARGEPAEEVPTDEPFR